MQNVSIPLMTSLFVLGSLVGDLAAQTVSDNSGSSSVSYFSESKSSSDGGAATSTTFALTATLGEDDPERASSTSFSLVGGFVGTLGATSSGPWVTSAFPVFVAPRSNNLVWLSGTRLDLSNPSVTVSGRAAAVVAKSPTDVAVQIPSLPEPGWHEIRLTNNGGTTSLERGVGVLPMLFTEGASASNAPFDLIFKGSQGDLVAWALGFGTGPKIPLGAFLHGLTMNPSPIRVLPSLSITDPSGEFRLPVPPVPFNFTIYTQALFISSNPGYAPGSFSNRLGF